MRKNQFSLTVKLMLAISVALTAASCTKSSLKGIKDRPGKPAKPAETVPPPATGRQFTLSADAEGHLVIDNSNGVYLAGDVLYLKGPFKSVLIQNLRGSAGNPIFVRNAPGTVLRIGDPSWNGGAWSWGISFRNSRYITVGGSSKSEFILDGSIQAARSAYFNLVVAQHSDNFEISNITVQNGGTGILAKTDPVKGDASTFFPNSYMENLSIHDVLITGTENEGMYIGHTALYWNLATNTPDFSIAPGAVVGPDLVRPIKWRNMKIYNNVVKNGGLDGIQISATDGLEVYGNEVTNWGLQHNSAHSGGLLIGGRITSSNVHDNYVHDGWGDIFQFFASGENGVKHIIRNNLFRDNYGNDGVSFRGTDNAVVLFTNNTVARTNGVSLRFNGYMGMTGTQVLNANALIQPRTGGGTVDARSYIYNENGAATEEGTGLNVNTKFATTAAAGVDLNNFYQPLGGSPLGGSGYRK